MENEKFDSSALNGLRGFAAVHVMIFHTIFSIGINTLGNVRKYTQMMYRDLIRVFTEWSIVGSFLKDTLVLHKSEIVD